MFYSSKSLASSVGFPKLNNAFSLMSTSERVSLSCYDRVAIGGELLLFDNPGERPAPAEGGDDTAESSSPPTAEFAVEELQAGLREKGKQAQEVCHTIALLWKGL